MWLIYALAAAGCAATINIFGKIGMREIDSDLATAVRSVVQAAFVVAFALAVGSMAKMPMLRNRPLAWTMLALSGVAGGLSWIFAFRAIQLSQISKVAPIDKMSMPLGVILAVILLRERPSWINWFGIALIVAGAYLTTVSRH
jgi:transporter family protein